MPILFTLRLQQHYWLHSKVLRLIIICTIVVLCIIKKDKQRGKHRKFDMAIAWYDGNLNISGCIKIWSWFLFYLYRDFTNIKKKRVRDWGRLFFSTYRIAWQYKDENNAENKLRPFCDAPPLPSSFLAPLSLTLPSFLPLLRPSLSSCSPLSSSVHLIIFSMSTHNTTASLTENQEKDHFDDGITHMVCPLPPIPHNLLICFPPLPPTEQQTKHWGMAAHNVSTPTICQATQHKANTQLLSTQSRQYRRRNTLDELSWVALLQWSSAASQNPASAASSKSFVNEEIHSGGLYQIPGKEDNHHRSCATSAATQDISTKGKIPEWSLALQITDGKSKVKRYFIRFFSKINSNGWVVFLIKSAGN